MKTMAPIKKVDDAVETWTPQLVLEQADKNGTEKLAEAEETLSAAVVARCETAEQYEALTDALKMVKGAIKALEADRTQLTSGLSKTLELIRARYRPAIERYTRAETVIKRVIAGYIEHQANLERKRIEAVANAAKAGNDTQARQLLARGPVEPPKVSGISQYTDYEVAVADLAQVPDEFLVISVNEQAVKAAARKGRTDFPGLVVTPVKKIRSAAGM